VSIHPFGDGNGRVSRLLMNYILEYHKQPLALIFSEDKADYFQALENSREQESLTPFRNFMYAQQTKFFEQEIAKLNQGTKWSFKR
jgi:Fic family protein